MPLIYSAQVRTCLLSAAALLIFLAYVPLRAQAPPQTPAELQLTGDEIAVYTTLFKEVYQAGPNVPIILSDQTALGVPPGMIAKIPTEGPQTKAFVDRLAPDTRADYTSKEHVSQKLPSPCNLAPKCITENAADMAMQVKGAKGWTKFFKKYPAAPGLIIVSRVGFNADHTQAFVYTGEACGTLCGQGEYVILAKRDGSWVVSESTVVWISQK
jgi:hypothetical protein